VSNRSVSIILTAPSDEDASILIGTIFVIDAIVFLASRSLAAPGDYGVWIGDGSAQRSPWGIYPATCFTSVGVNIGFFTAHPLK
jgi:hypothetical protein